MDVLKDFDFGRFLVLIAPGAMMALFRSFALKGAFPTIGKDDFAVFLLGSALYDFLLASTQSNLELPVLVWRSEWSFLYWMTVLILVPAFIGFGLGLVESTEVIGRSIRKVGLTIPSPTPTAWETLFKELRRDTVLIVTLEDGTQIYGRWTAGPVFSSASTDADKMDLYLAEIGTFGTEGYVPKTPQRGIYISASQIRLIEIISPFQEIRL